MKLDVLPVAGKIHASKLMDTTAIVVDVLRSSTCMIEGVRNGAAKIIPATDAAEAASFQARLGLRECILAGETGGLRIPDFDIGNSPFEFTEARMKDRTVIMNTTNGTNAVCEVESASAVYIGAMVNASAVAKRAWTDGRDVLIVCAGTDGKISADDILAAGAIAEEIWRLGGEGVELTDVARLCIWIYKGYQSGCVDLSDCLHVKRLRALGFEKDIEFCFTRDATDVVPEYKYGVIQ